MFRLGEIWTAALNDPILIDECLSPNLVSLASARQFNATHVVFRGLRGALDHELIRVIQNENFVFVTTNAKDFLSLYANLDLHPGLIIIIPGNLSRALQMEFFGRALDFLALAPDIVDEVVEIFSDGTVAARDWPKP